MEQLLALNFNDLSLLEKFIVTFDCNDCPSDCGDSDCVVNCE